MDTCRTIQAGRLTIAAVLAGVSIFAGCAEGRHEGTHVPSAMQSPGQSSVAAHLSDANIVALLAVVNESDIEGGQLAEEKAASREVQAFGARMVADHSALLQQGTQLSKQLMIHPVRPELAEQLVSEHERSTDKLKTKAGEEFDRAYIEHEIKMHQKVIGLVEEATQAAHAPQLRMLLERSRPALEEHLQQAQQVKHSLTASR